MLIQNLNPTDAPHAHNLHREAVQALQTFYTQAERDAWTSASVDDFHAAIEAAHQTAAIWTSNQLVGYALVRPKTVLWHLYIHPQHQGYGFGLQLLCHIESQLVRNNVHELTLHANDSAVGFYEKQGYQKGERVFIPMRGEKISTYRMVKSLA